jgi:branched-chain amino acid transport system ATP-binding protein
MTATRLPPMPAPTLALERVRVAYGKVEAVRGVSLSVERGSIVTVIGANGAGKTTLLHAAMGILPAAGRVMFEGAVLDDHAIEERVAMGLALVPERRELFASMAVEDNLELGGFRATASERSRRMAEVYARFPRLQERRRQLAGTLSGGERQMLAMGRALMGRPRLLMLDEPSLGLAPLIVRDIFEIILGLKKTGVSILLVEQNARAALQAADYGYVMELGLITAEGPASELACDPRIIESYLGLGGSA